MLTFATPAVASAGSFAFDAEEAKYDAKYAQSTIALAGRVVDGSGAPVAGATVTVVGFGEGAVNAGKIDVTDGTGQFALAGLRRRSVLLKVSRGGWYTEIVPVDLQRPLAEKQTALGDVVMTARRAGRARLLFVGDTMLGRRFTDEDEDGVEGEAGDLIRPGSRASDARAIVAYVRDVVSSADLAVANLECAVTDAPETPHPYKSYVFHSHPDTLAGLTYAGFDAVDLANNHVFDYLGDGVFDTINAVAGSALEWTGADMSESAAADTTIYTAPQGVPLTLQGFSAKAADGSQQTKYLLVARDPDKPGALEASDANMTEFMASEPGDRFVVPMIHGGVEYSSYPDDEMRRIFVELVEQGAGLVVGHHTHTAQGIGVVDSPDGPRFVMISLGNFIFDQSIFESWQSMIAIADVDLRPDGGFDVARLQLLPVHVEWYVPKLLAGAWMARMGRRLGHLSSTLPDTPQGGAQPDGLSGALVFPAGSRVVALQSGLQCLTKVAAEQLALPVEGGSTGVVEFARADPADALAAVQTGGSAQLELGREILLYGDFEDLDVDGTFHEGSMWDQGDARYLENSVVRRGIGAAVLLRDGHSEEQVTMTNQRPIPVAGGTKLTVRGYVRGDNAGTFRLSTITLDADDDEIATVERFARSGGTYGWARFVADFTLPNDAARLQLALRQAPPGKGEGRVFVDDLEVIAWSPADGDAKAGVSLPTPNEYGYLRFTEVAGAGPLPVTLTHRSHALP